MFNLWLGGGIVRHVGIPNNLAATRRSSLEATLSKTKNMRRLVTLSKKPKLVVVSGRPGAGKTTFAKKLGESIELPVFCRDEFKEGYVRTFEVNHKNLAADTNKIVTDTFFETTGFLLSKNVSLIAEAAFQHPVWEVLFKKV